MNRHREHIPLDPDQGSTPVPQSGRLRMPPIVVMMFGGASLLSAELFSHFNGAPFALKLVALMPLQAVGLIWFLSQRSSSEDKQYSQAD